MASKPDYSILHAPRITAANFAAILRAGSSPAYPEAAACYRAAVAKGVDPAVLLAVFRKESTFGRFGRARGNRSWGNLRRSPNYPTVDGFVRYPSWSAGAADAARLLAIYGRNQIRPGKNTSTVQTMPYVWAPASDGNGPDRYGDQLARWIHDWSGAAGDVAVAADQGSNAGTGKSTGGGGSSSVGAGKTTAAGGGKTMAEYLGVPPATIFTAALLVQFLDKVRTDTGTAGAYGQDYLRLVYEPQVGKRCGDITYIFNASNEPSGPNGTWIDQLAAGIGDAAKNVAALVAILVLIVLALYRLVR